MKEDTGNNYGRDRWTETSRVRLKEEEEPGHGKG